jgi:hypothetical protein
MLQNPGILHQDHSEAKSGVFWCKSPVHSQSMIYGYARVSTDGQSVATQVSQLKAVRH